MVAQTAEATITVSWTPAFRPFTTHPLVVGTEAASASGWPLPKASAMDHFVAADARGTRDDLDALGSLGPRRTLSSGRALSPS